MVVGRFWNPTFKSFFASVVCLVALSACTRAKDETSKISLSLPQKMMHSMSAQSGDVLNVVIINVTGPNISPAILKNFDSCRDCNPVRPVPSSMTLEIPVGDNRLIQVLAVYMNPVSQKMTFFYGDKTTNLTAGNSTVEIGISRLGNATDVISGLVSGRLINGTSGGIDFGPSGEVSINYNPGGGKPAITIERDSIVNGWFSFFMLAGADLEYVLAPTGQKLFTNGSVNLESSLFGHSNRVVKVATPTAKREENWSGVSEFFAAEAQYYVWGYFGNATSLSNKRVCVDTTEAIQNLKLFTNNSQVLLLDSSASALPARSTLLQTSPAGQYAYIRGGVPVGGTGCSPSEVSNDIYSSLLKVETEYFDGNGKDRASGFYGVFTRNNQGHPFSITPSDDHFRFQGQFLPGVSSVLNKAFVYKKATPFADHFYLDTEYVTCKEIADGAYGFQPAGSAVADGSGNVNILSNIALTDGSLGVSVVMCVGTASGPMGRGIFVDPSFFGGGGSGPGPSGPPAKISFRGPLAVNINSCVEGDIVLLTATDQEADGSENTSGINVSLMGTAGLSFREDGCGGSTVSSTTVEIGNNSRRVGIVGNSSPSNSVVTVSYTSGFTSALADWTQTFPQVAAGQPVFLQIVKGDSNFLSGLLVNTCVQMKIQSKKSDMTPANFNGAGSIILTGHSVQTFSDSGCSTPTSSVAYTSSTSESSYFYIQSTSAGWANISASIPSYTDSSITWSLSGIHGFQVGSPGEVTTLKIVKSGTVQPNACLTGDAQLRDAGDNAVNAASTTTVDLSSMSGITFYPSVGCTGSPITSVNINSGSANGTFYFRLSGASGPWSVVGATNYNSKPLQGYLNEMTPNIAILQITADTSYDFGQVAYLSSANRTFTITNSGTTAATSMTGLSLTNDFFYVGGGYPGTVGNCTSTLAAGSTCTIQIAYSPSADDGASDTSLISISYNNGQGTVSADSSNITGQETP